MGEGETGHIRGLNVCAGGAVSGGAGEGRKIFHPYGDGGRGGRSGIPHGLNVCTGESGAGRCGRGRKIFRPYGDLGGMGEGMSFVPMMEAYRRGQDMLHRLNPCPKVTSVPPW